MRMIFCIVAFLSAMPLMAKPKIVTTTTDLAWLAREIGQDKIEVIALLKGTENPHFVDAVPEYIRLVANADVVCAVGLGLEVGWLPKVLAKSGNAPVQKGGKGFCEVGPSVEVLSRGIKADRAMGDVHPNGNPHFWLSPIHLGQAGEAITAALIEADVKNGHFYRKRQAELVQNLAKLQADLKVKLAPMSGTPIMQYHSDFDYFFAAYGLNTLGSIEEKPGVPPSAGRLARVGLEAKQNKVLVALAVDYDPKGPLDKFAEISGATIARVPTSVRPKTSLDTYAKVQEFLVEEVLKAAGKRKRE